MKVVVGGGSGLVGLALVRSLAAAGHEVVVLSRSSGEVGAAARMVAWDQAAGEIDGADAVVNLAGTSIAGPRWTRARKQSILVSRVETTRALVAAIEAAERRPGVLVTSSGIDYYGASGDAVVDESSPPGDTFLAQVCVAWERAAAAAPIRQVALRTSLVVSGDAFAIRLMALPFRLFAGGPIGGGRQWFPWVHLEDLVRLYRLAIDDADLAGAVNAVAPEQIRQGEAARELAGVLHRPAALPTPSFAVRAALGEEADLLLHGQRAVSGKLGAFDFRYPGLRAALEDAFG
jgi:uncharacterized protein